MMLMPIAVLRESMPPDFDARRMVAIKKFVSRDQATMLSFCALRAWRRWSVLGALAVTMGIAAAALARAQFGSGLVARDLAQQSGLERAWFARARVNPARSDIARWILSGDQLLLVTSAGVCHALDANTGQTLWITPIGNPDYPSLGPATNDKYVALVNGSTLYLLDRATGRALSQRRVGSAPGGGPALASDYVFVPLITDRVEGYKLDAIERTPWYYQSFGRIMAAPRTTPENVVWATDAGFLYIASTIHPAVRFRLETASEFAAEPASRAPFVYAVSLAGELLAIDEQAGALRWKYLTGFPTDRAPAAVGDRLYVSSEEPMLHSVDAATGIGQWQAPGISQFAAATKSRVYGVDQFGTIHVLDRATGAPVGRIPSGGALTALVNDQTDRLFLISASGLVQCLYEIGATEPTYYVQPPSAAEEAPAEEKPAEEEYHGDEEAAPAEPKPQPAARPVVPPQESEEPFGPPAPEEEANPFGPPAAEETQPPAEDNAFGAGEDENPFE
jgi:outer membrane protein assembly factor BamB